MAPKSPWKKATANNTSKTITTDGGVTPAINYGEVQSEEVEVLQAIYGDDYEEVEIKGAWSKTTDRSFKLKLKSSSDPQSHVTLIVRLTATYPKTAPILEAQGLQPYHERTQNRIANIVNKRPQKLLGEVMIHAIATEIEDAIEDAVQARQQGTLPSLEEERATAEEAATVLAKEVEETELRRQQDEQDEEDRALKQMVDDEIARREKRKAVKLPSQPTQDIDAHGLDVVTFYQPEDMRARNDALPLGQVEIMSTLSETKFERTYLAKPHTTKSSPSQLVAVKRITIQKDRESIMGLESVLTSTLKLRHDGLLRIFGYRVDTLSKESQSELVVCSEYADRGSMQDILEVGGLHLSKARQFTTELLEALDYLHRNGLSHGCLTLKTVAVTSNPISLKLADYGYYCMLQDRVVMSTKWPTPESDHISPATQRKSDIWQLGVVICQMFIGLQVTSQHTSPQAMLSKLNLSESFEDFARKMFTIDAKKRPSAFDLLPAEFLRTDDPVMDDTPLATSNGLRTGPSKAGVGFESPSRRRSRHNSSNVMEPMSRYANDFTEIGRLGKGGFGEVVKARNKLDGGVYAVKKIKQASQLLDQVISEVMLLNRLNHPYVVRYFSTWVEEDSSGAILEDSATETETATETATEEATEDDSSDGPRMDFGYQSTGGLDFVSSQGYPQIEFGDDSEDESEDEDGGGEDIVRDVQNGDAEHSTLELSVAGDARLRKARSDSRRAPSTLYIQMEYCERHTLRDLIRRRMSEDDSWRYARQITEGLAHIHGHGIIHRDLKPDNIFIDVAGNPKIGDFGLATTSQHQVERAATMSGISTGDMTRSVGTTLYVAPELRSASGAFYNDKVDMYSLGIMFYEMCEPFSTAMERIKALQKLREKDYDLPTIFQSSAEMAAQGRLISCLISHKPSERPSSTELLRSDILPLKIEDETIRQALAGLSDERSPYHQKMMSALFARDSVKADRVKALAWDARGTSPAENASRLRLRGIAKHTLASIFRRHGAEEARRQSIFPRSESYTNPNLVQLLDASGNMLQLPYDLTLPNARHLALQSSDVRCTFAFGNAYRDEFKGGPPRVNEEVDFDIIDSGADTEHSLNDAEVLKVMDEIISEMPLFPVSTITSFHLNHSAILDIVMEHCRIPVAQRPAIKEIISRLGFHQHTWNKVRVDLRKFGLPDTTLDDLQQFDFRDVPDKAFSRLRTLFEGANPRLRQSLDNAITLLTEVVHFAAQFSVQRKLYISPLGAVNAKFYEDGILFQCVLERKANRVVVAAGGRYDSLIRAQRPLDSRTKMQGAVGVSIGLDPILSNMAKSGEGKSQKKYLKLPVQNEATQKRCDVLISTTSSEAVQSAGIKLLTTLWANDISAELANHQGMHAKEYSFVVTVRHEASNNVRMLNVDTEVEEDVEKSALVSHLQQELRERDHRKPRHPALLRQASSQDTERKSNVHVLIARHGSKKSNKYQIVSDAQEQWSRKLDDAKQAPILAVETRDDMLDLIQQTRFSDAETWRRAIQSVQLNDRQYIQQIQEMLASWRKTWSEGDGVREACVFNFRTQRCIYYDLGL